MANPRKLPQGKSARISTTSLAESTSARQAQLLVQPVELAQSQELVQIMACAVVSTVASLRSLFHEDCFKVHYYDVENPNHSYRDFRQALSHNLVSADNGRRRIDNRYVPWDILVPGTDPRVDKLLEWLELGMVDALSHKYLDTLQLGVYDGEVCLSKRVEAYIMTFSYLPDGVQMKLQLSTACGLPAPISKRIESVKQDLRLLVHRLANHIGGFPDLPAAALVNMQFTYNDACPPEYQPPGFVKCQDHALILRGDQGAKVGTLNSGPHRVHLREDGFEVPRSPDPLTIIKLRGSTGGLRRIGSMVSNEAAKAVNQKSQKLDRPILAHLHPDHDLQRRCSIASNVTADLDTQERAQLAAISNMARLRPAHDDLNDTQILDATESQSGIRRGSVDLDEGPSTVYESSTQGSPSTAGGCRGTRHVTTRSAIEIPAQDALVTLRPRKREMLTEGVETHKLRKVSKARSPFATALLKN